MKAYKHTDDTRLALLEQSINNINDTLKSFEKRFDKLDSKLDNLEIGNNVFMSYKKVDSGFKDFNNRLWSNFLWTISATTTVTFFLIKYSPHFIK